MEFYFDNSNFGEFKAFVGKLEPGLLRISETIISIIRFISGIASFTVFNFKTNKEKSKGFLYSKKNILQDLGMNGFEINIFFLSLRSFCCFILDSPFSFSL